MHPHATFASALSIVFIGALALPAPAQPTSRPAPPPPRQYTYGELLALVFGEMNGIADRQVQQILTQIHESYTRAPIYRENFRTTLTVDMLLNGQQQRREVVSEGEIFRAVLPGKHPETNAPRTDHWLYITQRSSDAEINHSLHVNPDSLILIDRIRQQYMQGAAPLSIQHVATCNPRVTDFLESVSPHATVLLSSQPVRTLLRGFSNVRVLSEGEPFGLGGQPISTTVNGVACHVLRLTQIPDGIAMNVYIDRQAGFIIRIESDMLRIMQQQIGGEATRRGGKVNASATQFSLVVDVLKQSTPPAGELQPALFKPAITDELRAGVSSIAVLRPEVSEEDLETASIMQQLQQQGGSPATSEDDPRNRSLEPSSEDD